MLGRTAALCSTSFVDFLLFALWLCSGLLCFHRHVPPRLLPLAVSINSLLLPWASRDAHVSFFWFTPLCFLTLLHLGSNSGLQAFIIGCCPSIQISHHRLLRFSPHGDLRSTGIQAAVPLGHVHFTRASQLELKSGSMDPKVQLRFARLQYVHCMIMHSVLP